MTEGDETAREPGEASEDAPLGKQAAEDVATVARGGGIQIFGQISQRGLGTLFTAVATRALGQVLFGRYRVVAQILAIAGQFGLAGFNYASMRFISRSRARNEAGGVKGAARVGLAGSAIASVLVVAGLLVWTEPVADYFTKNPSSVDEVVSLLRLGAAYIPLFAFMQVLRYCTQAYKTMVPSVVAGNIVQPAARFVLGMAAFAVGLEVTGAVGSLTLSMAVGMIVAAVLFRRMLTDEERSATPSSDRKGMIGFALPQAGASLLGVQTLGLGVLVLGRYSNESQVAAFSVALALQGPGTVFLGGIVNIWAPVVSDLYDRKAIDRLSSLYKTITRWVGTFSFPVFAAIIIMPDLFASLLARSDLASAAAPVAAILAVGNLFYTGTGPTGYVISMSGRPTINFINSVVAVCLYVFIGAAVADDHGAVGVAWVDAGVTAFINSVRIIQARVLVGVQPYGRSFFKPIFATLIAAGVLLVWKLIPGDAVVQEIAGLAVAGVVYFVILRLFGLDAEERYVLGRIVKRLPRPKG